MLRSLALGGAPLQARREALAAERNARLSSPRPPRGFSALDKLARGVRAPTLVPRAPRAAVEDPFRGLTGIALLRAIRAAVDAKKQRLEYGQARHLIFETVENVKGAVTCIYTGRVRQGTTVPDPEDMNVEHIWPQSRGAKGIAKSDLHNLMVADTEANSERGNLPYGIVKTVEWAKGGSSRGVDASGQMVFMPRPSARGRVARATFYFATVYGFPIDAQQEAVLRAWHKAYPPDAAELERHRLATQKQGSPNYFILYPELLDRVPSFPKQEQSAVAA